LTSRGRLLGGTLLAAVLSACGAAQTAVPAPVAPEREAVRAPELPEEVTPFHSVRLELTVPLPDRERWRTVEAPRGDLELTHVPTRSRLTVALFADPELVSRQKCEERARDRKLVPDGALTTVEDTVVSGPENFDTRVWVALEPGATPDAPLVGHVLAFGGFLRKCLVFHFSSAVDSARDEDVLSERLAVARTRILAKIALDPFDQAPAHQAPGPARER
jgi:hypothetical protein